MTVTVEAVGRTAFVTIDNPPVNAVGHAVRQGLMDAVHEVDAMSAIDAAILLCAGRTFIAGADIREFGRPPVPPHLPDVILAIEGAETPWIAAMHGTALGGGLEVAMGCHYRIGIPDAKFGLPEVTLGLIPGAGGTVRLPRLVGVARALEIMTSGKPITANEAQEAGLLDEVVEGDLRVGAQRFAEGISERERPTPVRARPVPAFDTEDLEARIEKVSEKARGQNSPVAVCDAVRNATTMTASAALAAEREAFLRLKEDPQSQALRHIFFAERSVGKSLLAAGSARAADHVGVVGGGTMGAGIAAACLLAGLEVTLIERDQGSVDAGIGRVTEILNGSLKRGLISERERDRKLGAFRGKDEYAALATADLVIEAVFEDVDAKCEVFRSIERIVQPEAVLATNTSYLDVGDIAASVGDPSRVIGLHFFSPAHIMKLLEIVVPSTASPDAVATGAALGKRLRKIVVPSGVCDGFIGNRIMAAYRRECEYMIEDGALPHEVDAAMRDFGFPMGVFEMQDLAGLDIAWAMRKRRAATRDATERYVDIPDKLCELGRLGRKAGRGWYDYEGGTGVPDPQVTELIQAEAARKGIARQSIGAAEIMERILGVMQQEGAAILVEGIAAQPGDIDVVMVNGYAFPRWRGGPMFMQDQQGRSQ